MEDFHYNDFNEIILQLKLHFNTKNTNGTVESVFTLHNFLFNNRINCCSDNECINILNILIFVAKNYLKIFTIEVRVSALDCVFHLLHDSKNVCCYLAENNFIDFLANEIILDNELRGLHLFAYKCMRIIAGHCENCQDFVCENLPINDILGLFCALPSDDGVTKTEYQTDFVFEVNEIHREIMLLLKNISKFPLHPDLIKFCFDMFLQSISLINQSVEMAKIGLLGVCYLTEQPREYWYTIYEQSDLFCSLSLLLQNSDPIVKQSSLLLLSSIYHQNQFIQGLPIDIIVDLLHYEDEQGQIQLSLRYYTAIAIQQIMQQDKDLIYRMVCSGLIDAITDIYDSSSYSVKSKLVDCLIIIALNGRPSDKLEVIKKNCIPYLINIIINGEEKQIFKALDSMDLLFSGPYKSLCYESFLHCPDKDYIAELVTNSSEIISHKAIEFMNTYFPN